MKVMMKVMRIVQEQPPSFQAWDYAYVLVQGEYGGNNGGGATCWRMQMLWGLRGNNQKKKERKET